MAEYQSGDTVKVYATPWNAAADAGGLDATIVRQMPDAEDFEVAYTEEPPEGAAYIVTVDLLRAQPRAKRSKSATAKGE